jgi:hypothetical protein
MHAHNGSWACPSRRASTRGPTKPAGPLNKEVRSVTALRFAETVLPASSRETPGLFRDVLAEIGHQQIGAFERKRQRHHPAYGISPRVMIAEVPQARAKPNEHRAFQVLGQAGAAGGPAPAL